MFTTFWNEKVDESQAIKHRHVKEMGPPNEQKKIPTKNHKKGGKPLLKAKRTGQKRMKHKCLELLDTLLHMVAQLHELCCALPIYFLTIIVSFELPRFPETLPTVPLSQYTEDDGT